MSGQRLIATERRRLQNLESTIAVGLRTFLEVGTALASIREERLYRETHETFEAYCQDRWGFTRQQAYRTIAAAEMASTLSPVGYTPASERVVRELVPLRDRPEDMREAWGRAVEAHGPAPTAQQVAAVVRDLAPQDLPRLRPVSSSPVLSHASPSIRARWKASADRLPEPDLGDDGAVDYVAWVAAWFAESAGRPLRWQASTPNASATALSLALLDGEDLPEVRDYAYFLARALLARGAQPPRVRLPRG